MQFLTKNNPDVCLHEALHLIEKKEYIGAEKALNHVIDNLSDNQSLVLAYQLRAKLFTQKKEISLAIRDLKRALSKTFFHFDVLHSIIELRKTQESEAVNFLNNTLNYWLYSRPQDCDHPVMLEALRCTNLAAFGLVQSETQEKITGWFYSSSTSKIIIEIDSQRFLHDCKESQFSSDLNKHIFTFSFILPSQFRYCRIGILGGNSLWGSPIAFLPEFHFSLPDSSHQQYSKALAVDIIIPVYRGLDETKACIESVYASLAYNKTKMRLIVVSDASPDTRLCEWLKQESLAGRLVLIERDFNVGFVGAVNTGLSMASMDHDVVLLNADTLVVNNWVDRLQVVSVSTPNVGTVTPISNNAELLSYPEPMHSNPMPDLTETTLLDQLFATLGGDASQSIPSGVGFCMYIRRALLNEQPFLNEKLIQRGYGEETEFCLKAAANGWENRVAANVFVAHKGNVSFGEEKSALAAFHVAQIHARFPHHSAEYDLFLQKKPLNTLFNEVTKKRHLLK